MSLPYYVSWSKQKNISTFEIKKVNGCIITTENDREIIDMTSISYQAHFGHNHPLIIKRIKEQLDTIPMSSPKGDFPHKVNATWDLLNYMQKLDGKIFYTSGGAETIENALKIARQITKKKIILARNNSYHGATMGALSVTGDWRNPPHQLPNDWVVRIPEPTDENAILKTREIIQRTGPNNIAAIIIETITGGNGVIIPTQAWWDGIQSLCDEFNIMLILDEVVCGFLRTGLPFGYMHFNIRPDMITLAKGITGGMIPFGALWTSKKIADFYEEEILCCGLTNYAHPLGIAAMRAVLEIVHDDSFLKIVFNSQKLFEEKILDLKKLKIVKDIRIIGHLCAIDLHKSIEWKRFFEAGIYLVAQPNRIILAPPLIIDEVTLKKGIEQIAKVFEENT